ncbi:FadR family transcriptional regulator [Sphingobium lactosutens]|uniref:FadR/GntR family transcriptional regulator n=1 Tax=Sphingobium lactosutens TaxID=522773 RepID=UPI0015B9073D|nr:FadR/GntR family transcriptional regulator [Sphingobium lactosutens]NWK96404.1 FadR family transcriptional regulator [Sphingobium lactosutens]
MTTRSNEEGGSLVDRAIQAVRDHIRDHDLKVGDKLPGEGTFATDLGVSRAVMREAFGALAALGLIDVANGRRAKVGAIDGSVLGASLDHAVSTEQISVAEVWDVRRTVEVRIAMLAAERRSEAQAQQIMALAQAMAGAVDDLDCITANDIAFHESIAQAADNKLFVQIVHSFAPLLRMAVPQAWRTRTAEEQRQTMLDRHLDLAKAIANGDPEAAGAAMEAHFDASIGQQLHARGGAM